MPDGALSPEQGLIERIQRRIDELVEGDIDDSGKTAVSHFAKVACVRELRLRLVPFFEPCVIFVLSGTKHLGEKQVKAGGCLAVPAPANFHMTNVVDNVSGQYVALVFPFDADDMNHVRTALGHPLKGHGLSKELVTFDADVEALEALDHYLQSGVEDSSARVTHRKREVLLILAERDPSILDLGLGCADWTQKLRAIFAEDPSKAWGLDELCDRLAVSDSTLRRHLKGEETSFRDVLSEFRLGNALMDLLMSNAPIYRVAHDNGFQSVSRFSENFRKRYGATPTELRTKLPETG